MKEAHELNFKEMCAQFDVTPRTLRYYEYIELLCPRRDGRSRYYGRREFARMTLILRGRRYGFALEQIRQWLDLYDGRDPRAQFEMGIELADARLAELNEQIDELTAARDELAALRGQSLQILAIMEARQKGD